MVISEGLNRSEFVNELVVAVFIPAHLLKINFDIHARL